MVIWKSMPAFWQKPFFWIVCFVVLLISIPVAFFYLSKYFTRPTPQAPTSINQTAPPVTAKPGSCLIVEEKYCSQAKLIDWTNPSGQKMKIIGFDLPADVPLLAPIDGQVVKIKLPNGEIIKGLQAIVLNPNSNTTLTYNFFGDLRFNNTLTLNMKKGEVFGYTQKTGIKNAGNYNLLFGIAKGSGRETAPAEDEMRNIFSSIKL